MCNLINTHTHTHTHSMAANITRKDPDCREVEKSRQRLRCVPYELFCIVDSSVSSVTFTLDVVRRDLLLRCKAAVTKGELMLLFDTGFLSTGCFDAQ